MNARQSMCLAVAALLAAAGCSKSTDPPTPSPAPSSSSSSTTSRSAADVERDAIGLVHAADPSVPDEQIQLAFTRVCDYIRAHPSGPEILGLRSEFVNQQVFNAVTATVVISGAVASRCPQYRPLLEGLS